MDVIGFRGPRSMWDTFGSVVGTRRRSSDLRAYVEWKVENPQVVLGSDPGTAGAGPQPYKFELDPQLCTMYSELFSDDGLMSADLRAYIDWRNAHWDVPLPGRGQLSVRNNQPPAES